MKIDRAKIVINAFTREYILTVFDGEREETLSDSFEDIDEWQYSGFFGCYFDIHFCYDQSFGVAIYQRYADSNYPNGFYTDHSDWVNPEIKIVLTDKDFCKD